VKEDKSVQIERGLQDAFVENHLPDGSRFLVDHRNETVYALNPTAGAAWDACSKPTTLCDVTREMQRSFDPEITEEFAKEAVLELQKRQLVTTSISGQNATRRQALKTLGKIALPLVIAMTLSEQRAHAQNANSGGVSVS
jgi:Coenzyme PQQ synthesis protein D (PqqD)